MQVPAFQFSEAVAQVFDDMLTRSVPLYLESIRRQAQMACEYYLSGTRIYDMGCSHGRMGSFIIKEFKEKPFSMVGVDSSWPMLTRYKTALGGKKISKDIHLVCGLAENIKIRNASVVIVNLTLQFITLEKREAFLSAIYQGLVPGGVLILTEKVLHTDISLSNLQLDFYKKFKRENGYSELEISQKRDALENVLIPETLEAHEVRLEKVGFKAWDVWLKWFNFASMIAVKR